MTEDAHSNWSLAAVLIVLILSITGCAVSWGAPHRVCAPVAGPVQ